MCNCPPCKYWGDCPPYLGSENPDLNITQEEVDKWEFKCIGEAHWIEEDGSHYLISSNNCQCRVPNEHDYCMSCYLETK